MTDTPPSENNFFVQRFRGYLPVTIDIETGGTDPNIHPILQIAVVGLLPNNQGNLAPAWRHSWNIHPYPNAPIDPASMKVNKIQLTDDREAESEADVLRQLFRHINQERSKWHCNRAILVAHNAWFDHLFLNAAAARTKLHNKNPFHPFSHLDTCSFAALACGKTVLQQACQALGIEFEAAQSHDALYDAERTCELFCHIFNKWDNNIGINAISTPNPTITDNSREDS